MEEEEEVEDEESNPEDTKYAYHEHMALPSRQSFGARKTRGQTLAKTTQVARRAGNVYGLATIVAT